MRRPRVRGSTPQTVYSCGSSPPMPTPRTSRPGASSSRSAIWRATSVGWRSGSRYTATYTGIVGVRGGERRGAHQAVEPRAHEEAHVIARAHVVEPGVGRASDELGLDVRYRRGTLQRWERATRIVGMTVRVVSHDRCYVSDASFGSRPRDVTVITSPTSVPR